MLHVNDRLLYVQLRLNLFLEILSKNEIHIMLLNHDYQSIWTTKWGEKKKFKNKPKAFAFFLINKDTIPWMNLYNFFNVIIEAKHIWQRKLPRNVLPKRLSRTFPLQPKGLLQSSQHKEVRFLRNTISRPASERTNFY